jgi:multidrug efflux pump subunit AcrA (membrane-fusion protein)
MLSLDARDPDAAPAVHGPQQRHALPPVSRGKGDRRVIGRLARAGAAACVLALTVAGCGGATDSHVQTAAVGRGMVVEVVAAPAVVTARATATVSAPADGTVRLLRAREGQRVRAGQVLLRVG